jgi:hypothetical protein
VEYVREQIKAYYMKEYLEPLAQIGWIEEELSSFSENSETEMLDILHLDGGTKYPYPLAPILVRASTIIGKKEFDYDVTRYQFKDTLKWIKKLSNIPEDIFDRIMEYQVYYINNNENYFFSIKKNGICLVYFVVDCYYDKINNLYIEIDENWNEQVEGINKDKLGCSIACNNIAKIKNKGGSVYG